MEEFLKYLVGAISGSAVSLAIVAYLGRKWLSHQLDKGLLRYKHDLDVKTEILKNDLSLFAHEQNVGISRIDLQRADAIKDIYSAIVDWGIVVNSLNFPPKSGYSLTEEYLSFYNQSTKRLSDTFQNLTKKIISNAIYLNSQTYENLQKVLKLLAQYSTIIHVAIESTIDSTIENKVKNIEDQIAQAKSVYDNEIDPIRGQLVDEFRKLLKAQ